jgi:hypothetical protein
MASGSPICCATADKVTPRIISRQRDNLDCGPRNRQQGHHRTARAVTPTCRYDRRRFNGQTCIRILPEIRSGCVDVLASGYHARPETPGASIARSVASVLRRRPIEQVVLSLIGGDSGPLLSHGQSEAEQRSFHTICRKLFRFLTAPRTAAATMLAALLRQLNDRVVGGDRNGRGKIGRVVR